jgi:hypothetical protein
MDFASEQYHINNSEVILQGFSLGGRSALKYGLEHPEQFRGLLLNTPALQGLLDAQNNPKASLVYKYENASKLPIYMIVGDQDMAYAQVLDKAYNILKKHDAIVNFNLIKGMGHTIPAAAVTTKARNFIAHPYQAAYDVELFEVSSSEHACSGQIEPKCVVRNLGDSTIHKLSFAIQAGSKSATHTWNGTLKPFQHIEITAPGISVSNGRYMLSMQITGADDQADPDSSNNKLSKSVQASSEGSKANLEQPFEDGVFEGWSFPVSGNIFSWYTDTDVKKDGKASIGSFNSILLFYTEGIREHFVSPPVDLSAMADPKISFDLAFNYHKYTPPYFTAETIFADTLQVLVSTDCGVSYTEVYRKGGAELATAAEPILNPLNIQSCYFMPGKEEWRKEVIDLKAFASNKNALVKFNYISNMGGSINLDNIKIGDGIMSVKESKEELRFSLFPNPASSDFQIGVKGESEVTVYDAAGRSVWKQSVAEEGEVSVSSLSNGLYYVMVKQGEKGGVQKLMVSK